MQTLTKKHWIALLLFITIEILRIIYCCSGGYYGVFLALGAIVLSWLILYTIPSACSKKKNACQRSFLLCFYDNIIFYKIHVIRVMFIPFNN